MASVSGGPERSLQTEAQLAGVITMPVIQDLAIAVACSFLPGLQEPASIGAQLNLFNNQQAALQQAACSFLPGLQEPAGIGAQLNLLNNQQAALQQAIIQGQQETPATLATKY